MSRENPRDLVKRARASIEMGRPEVGLPLAARAAAMAPNDAWVLMHLAWLEHQTKRPADALRTCARAIAANPEYEWPHRLRGLILSDLNQFEAARASLAEAVRIEPDNAMALRSLARSAAIVSRCEEALQAGRRATEVEPQNANSWRFLGFAASICRDWQTAESALIHARELAPDDAETHNDLGVHYAKLGRLEEAETCYRASLAINPRSENAFRNLARCLRRLDRWEEAEDATRRHRVERLHEANQRVQRVGDCSAYTMRAAYQGMLRRDAAAAADLRRAAELAETPWEVSSVKRSSTALAIRTGRMGDAAELGGELLADTEDPVSLQVSAEIGWLTGDPTIAERAARLAEERGFGQRWTSICRASAALAAGRWRDAIGELETHLGEHFGRTLCCENAQAAYASYMDGDLESARSYLRSAADEDPDCNTLRVLDRVNLMPVRELLPAEIRPWLLSELPLA